MAFCGSQRIRFWFLTYYRAAKAQTSLRFCCSHTGSTKTPTKISELKPGLIRHCGIGGPRSAYAIRTKLSCTGPYVRRREKNRLRGLRTTKAQTSLRIPYRKFISNMRGSRNFRQGGGGPGQSDKKSFDNVFFFFLLILYRNPYNL